MNPLAIRAENYRTFERLELDLPAGCCAIVGENGAGKSSLVNVVDLALFGPESRSWAPYLRQGGESTELLVELTFEHRGETYRVRRGYSARGRGKATLDLEREYVDDAGPPEPSVGWHPLTRETIEATQSVVDELLGLSRETFRASAFLAQGDGAAFTEAQPRERKRILAEVLGLGIWDLLLERARIDKRATEDELTKIAGTLEGAGAAVAAKPGFADAVIRATAEEVGANQSIRALEENLRDVAEKVKQAEEAQRAVSTAELLLVAAKAQSASVEKTQREATIAEATRSQTQAELEVARPKAARYDAAMAELNRAREERTLFEAASRERNEKTAERDRRRSGHESRAKARDAMLERKQALSDRAVEIEEKTDAICDRCEQPLGSAAKAAALNSLADEIAALRETITNEEIWLDEEQIALEGLDEILATWPTDAAAPDLDALTRAVEDAGAARATIAALEERLASLTMAIDEARGQEFLNALQAAQRELDRADQELELARSTAPDPAKAVDLHIEGDRLAKTLEEERNRHSAAVEARAKAEQMLTQIEEIEKRVAAELERRRELQGELDLLAILERAYGRDGVPALIVSSVAIPQIETEASRILAELGTSYRVELRTEKALQGGKTADALDVVVITETGERPYETFSGGERTRLNLALRIALARLLAHRRGAESRLLAIDEPEYLDAAGTAALAGVLRGLESDFERIYLISHVPDLRDAFETSIEVVKDDDVSRIAA